MSDELFYIMIFMSSALDRLLSPAQLHGIQLRNRIFKSATYEGLDDLGVPSQRLIDFHARLAEGGTALTTLAYCTPEPDGRLHKDHMYIHQGIGEQLKKLAVAVHEKGGKLSGQLIHYGGTVRNTALMRKRPIAPSGGPNKLGFSDGVPWMSEMTLSQMDDVTQAYARTAGLLKSWGFDAVELHFGHGLLMGQFLSPRDNKRSDQYGGTLINRMRFPLRVFEAVRREVGDDFPIFSKISTTDDLRGGIKIEETLEVCRTLEKAGMSALVLSGGSLNDNPMLLFHGQSFLGGIIKIEKNPLMKMAMRLTGPLIFKKYPYRELYFLDNARKIRQAVRMPLIYVGGCTEVQSFETLMNEGLDFIQLGRALIRDPFLVNNLKAERQKYSNGCIHCNQCIPLMSTPTGASCPIP